MFQERCGTDNRVDALEAINWCRPTGLTLVVFLVDTGHNRVVLLSIILAPRGQNSTTTTRPVTNNENEIIVRMINPLLSVRWCWR